MMRMDEQAEEEKYKLVDSVKYYLHELRVRTKEKS